MRIQFKILTVSFRSMRLFGKFFLLMSVSDLNLHFLSQDRLTNTHTSNTYIARTLRPGFHFLNFEIGLFRETSLGDGKGGKSNPWHLVEAHPADVDRAKRVVEVEYIKYFGPSSGQAEFIGKVHKLPAGYGGTLKKGDLVVFVSKHIDD